jgi:plasmid stabilization system protein ParE
VHRVVVGPSALADIEEHYRYLSAHASSPDYPDAWYEGIEEAILGLGDFPRAFSRAPEDAEFAEEIRHCIKGSYRVIFTILPDHVHVLHVRHVRQDVLRRED